MPKIVETFILGSGKVPDWVKGFMTSGIIQKVENDDEVFYRINTPVGIKKAIVGDVIVKTRSGVSLVPADKAEKYKMIQKKPQKVEKVDDTKEDIKE